MATRVVRKDDDGLYVKGNYGEKCRPSEKTSARPGDRYECDFSAGQASSITWVKTGHGKWHDRSEEWVDEDTIKFNRGDK
jgi:hypothetical protein